MPKKKAKTKPEYKVYIVTSDKNTEFYIGMTSKTGTELEKYFGSSQRSQGWEDKQKTILFQTEKKSHARFVETMLQIYFREDDCCVNDMINIRTNARWLKEITDERIYEICEETSRLLEMQLKRRRSDLQRRIDALLLMSSDLSEQLPN